MCVCVCVCVWMTPVLPDEQGGPAQQPPIYRLWFISRTALTTTWTVNNKLCTETKMCGVQRLDSGFCWNINPVLKNTQEHEIIFTMCVCVCVCVYDYRAARWAWRCSTAASLQTTDCGFALTRRSPPHELLITNFTQKRRHVEFKDSTLDSAETYIQS